MPTPERTVRRLIVAAWTATAVAPSLAAAADPAPYRDVAPIVVSAPAPFVQAALPPAVYAHAAQDELRDLRIVDARGERVPFALLAPRSTLHTTQQLRAATLYPLPARPSAG